MTASEPTLTAAPIRLTDSAVAEIKRLMQIEAPAQKPFLRIGVKGGGCSGFTYILEFDGEQPGDQHYVIDGIPVVIQHTHLLYLYGLELDYQTGLNARGFVFHNPNAKETCGCGSSFST